MSSKNYPLPGGKRRRSGAGAFEAIRQRRATVEPGSPSPATNRLAKAPYQTAPTVVRDFRPAPQRRPLSKKAENLLTEFFRRFAFWVACRSNAPVEWAGEQFLGTKRRRSYEVLKEIDEARNPHRWFILDALQLMQDGGIGRGRETEKSEMADVFFTILAGEPGKLEELRHAYYGCGSVDIAEVRRDREPHEKEAIDYIAFSNLLARRRVK
jgi:hypothetical protein